MNEQIQLKSYIIETKEHELKFKLKPSSKTDKITILVISCFLFISFLVCSIISFIKSGYFYAIMFLICSATTIYLAIFVTVLEKKKLLNFEFTINSSGITHSDLDRTYFISWSEIVSYGFLNFCALSYSRRHENESQMCVYFGKTEFSEKTLRKRINKMSMTKYGHCSSTELMVLALGEEDKNNLYYEFISRYINTYCSKEKEINYFIETCPW